MNKIPGYIISVVGLITILLSQRIISLPLPLLENINSLYLAISGFMIVIIGVLILLKFSNTNSKQEQEVPIYEGKGKKRKVVGYQRE